MKSILVQWMSAVSQQSMGSLAGCCPLFILGAAAYSQLLLWTEALYKPGINIGPKWELADSEPFTCDWITQDRYWHQMCQIGLKTTISKATLMPHKIWCLLYKKILIVCYMRRKCQVAFFFCWKCILFMDLNQASSPIKYHRREQFTMCCPLWGHPKEPFTTFCGLKTRTIIMFDFL